jgi:hypothetical protein
VSRRSIVFLVVYLMVTVAVVAGLTVGYDLDLWLGGMLFVLSLVLLLLIYFVRYGIVVVDEMSVAVVFDRGTQNFAYFIDSNVKEKDVGERPFNLHRRTLINTLYFNRKKYHHFINPLHQYVKAWISKRPMTVKGATEQIRTREGVPVTVHWSFSYNMDPIFIRPGIEFRLARALPEFSNNMIGGRVIHSLRYQIERMSVNELYTEDAIKNLEITLRQEVNDRAKNLGFVEIIASDVRVGPIEMPQQVEKAIEAAHERELQTATAVKALEDLRHVVSQFASEDMERLAELERLRILDEHGGSFVYAMSSLMKTVQKTTTHQTGSNNGR